MDILNNFYAIKDASVPTTSEETWNRRGDTLTVLLEGNFVGAEVKILGCSDLEIEEFHPITGFDSSFGLTDTMKTAGLYTFPIDGMGKFKVEVAAINGGSMSVFCRVTTGG